MLDWTWIRSIASTPSQINYGHKGSLLRFSPFKILVYLPFITSNYLYSTP